MSALTLTIAALLLPAPPSTGAEALDESPPATTGATLVTPHVGTSLSPSAHLRGPSRPLSFHAGPPAAGPAATPPPPEGPAPQPAPRAVVEKPPSVLDEIPPLSFPAETLQLSRVLEIALANNLDLRVRAADVAVSEASITQALGAFDLQVIAGTSANRQKSTPRGSQFVFSTGSRTISGYAGLRQRLPTGGQIDLRFTMSRTLTDQPTNIFNPTGSAITQLGQYIIAPSITLTHPLLRGLGLKVNRAAIERAKLATHQSQALAQQQTQDLLRDIINAYWDLLFARLDLDNKQRAVILQREQLDRTLAQIAGGRRPPVEAKSVQQALANAETEVLVAENTIMDRSLTLRTLMGAEFSELDVLAIDPLTDPGEISPVLVDHRTEIQRALAQNPTLRQLQLALASRNIEEIEAANQRLPQLNFSGTFTPQGRAVDTSADPSQGRLPVQVGWRDAFSNFVSDDVRTQGLLADYTVTGALDLTWDVQARVAKGNHARVLAEIRRAEVNLARQRQTVTAAVVRAVNSMRTAAKRMELARVSVELAEDNLAAEQARFEAGRSTNYDVVFRINELNNARQTEVSAKVDYLKAASALMALNGDIYAAMGLAAPGGGPR